MFIQPNFTFNGIYSKDLGVSIVTFDGGVLNDMGIEYVADVSVEHSLVEYNPYYAESPTESNEIELNLVLYNPTTMKPLNVENVDMEALYDWLITDNFAPFISDDDTSLIYYFKVIKIQKVLSFKGEGYLRVSFKPFSKYVYKREEYETVITTTTIMDIYNPSRQIYYPIIEVTNKGDKSTVNKINDMELNNIGTNETIIIDNLSKIVQSANGENRFSTCNRKWIDFKPRKKNEITLTGNMSVKIICEFPLIK